MRDSTRKGLILAVVGAAAVILIGDTLVIGWFFGLFADEYSSLGETDLGGRFSFVEVSAILDGGFRVV